jgi:heme/copper-type cytochrome/quinol oxidase subunit 3
LDASVTKRAELGMAMFLISEAVFFFLLILASFYFGRKPQPVSRLGLLLLLASNLCMWRGWRWVTIPLGAAFLVALAGTGINMLTGIHGLHMLAGLIALAVVPASALKVMAMYWYFFSAVWLAIFALSFVWGAA